MTTALWLMAYGGLVSWLAPPLLHRLTRSGVSPRMGVAAWLTAIGAVLCAWAVSLMLIAGAAVEGLSDSSAVTLCLELFGISEHTPLPGRLGALGLIAVGLVVSLFVIDRVCRRVWRLRSRSHAHAHAARLIGRPTVSSDVVVVDAEELLAYCVVGRPDAIVITSAALNSLNGSQLAAVLAHERAHIRGRHHHALMVLRALATTVPRLPLFRDGSVAVAELLEMCADDAAARRHGSRPLLDGLLALSSPGAAPAGGLAAAGTAVGLRAMRLAAPARRGERWIRRLALAATMATMVSAPLLIELLCHH
ncbi:M56 family metallopeptidase [soil metagenome]